MAERIQRVAVFHAGPRRGTDAETGAGRWYQRLLPERGARAEKQSAGAAPAKGVTKGSVKAPAAAPAKGSAKTSAKPAAKPTAKGAVKRGAKPTTKPAAGGGSRAARGRTRTEGSAAPRTPKPLLQRDSLGPVLARAVVMALALVAMVAFAVLLAKATLVPSPASVHLIHTNLRPGASIRAYLDQPALRDTVKQIGGNVVLGMPFGVLLPALFPRARGLVRVVLVTALVMVIVESIQGTIVEGRAFDIDDVILNTSGALIGYLLLGRRLGRALHPRRTHWWHRLGFGTPPAQPAPPSGPDRSASATRARGSGAGTRARGSGVPRGGSGGGSGRGSGGGSGGLAGWFRRDRPPTRKRR